jgi:hypothetical protein
MPAYARPGELIVIFERRGQPADEQVPVTAPTPCGLRSRCCIARLVLEPDDRPADTQRGLRIRPSFRNSRVQAISAEAIPAFRTQDTPEPCGAASLSGGVNCGIVAN